MIEHLNARRMVAVIIVLILLCIIIVILEETITDNVDRPTPYFNQQHHQQHSKYNDSNINFIGHHHYQNESRKQIKSPAKDFSHPSLNVHTISCLSDEPFVVETRCTLCSWSERTNRLPYCIATGYKEQIYCQKSGQKIWQTCDTIISMFYMFELFMLLMSIVFTFYIRKRQSMMNRAILSRIEKQISSGV